ncbi:MAG: delta-lactam-biosynthetic de-N-acetylase [Clostridium sp.]
MKNKKILLYSMICVLSFTLLSCSSKKVTSSPNDNIESPPPTVTKPNEDKPTNESKPNTEDKPLIEEKPNTEDKPTDEIKPETPKPTPSNLNNSKISWWYVPNKEGKTPGINSKIGFDLNKYNGLYVGDTSRKVLYLTIDEGYENGYTSQILDVLKKNNVKATFFVTSPYIKSQPDLIKRMVADGHIVGNHSKNHPSMPSVSSDTSKFNNEFKDVEVLYKNLTGLDMPKFFRPPMGEYSEKTMSMTNSLGYKTVFWSFAYNDWDVNNQPDKTYAKQKIMDGLHPGAVLLLHAVSKTNTEILDEVIKDAKALGYEFELIN